MYLLLSMDLEQGGLTPNLNMFIKHEYTISQQTIDVLTKNTNILKCLKCLLSAAKVFLLTFCLNNVGHVKSFAYPQ